MLLALDEGNPQLERVERQTLGTTTYKEIEVVHHFADAHPWFHPALIIAGIVVIAGVIWSVMRKTSSAR